MTKESCNKKAMKLASQKSIGSKSSNAMLSHYRKLWPYSFAGGRSSILAMGLMKTGENRRKSLVGHVRETGRGTGRNGDRPKGNWGKNFSSSIYGQMGNCKTYI